MLRITVRTPANTLNEIFAQDTTVFQTVRGPVDAVGLRTESDPAGPDQIQYRAYCPNGTWFTVSTKETI